MPSTVELVESRTLTLTTQTQVWASWPYADPATAETAAVALSQRPLGMLLRDLTTSPWQGEHEDCWRHEFRYEVPQPNEPDPDEVPGPGDPEPTPDPQFSFELGLRSTRKQFALDETKFGIASQMPDFQAGVDWDGQQFRGVDVLEPYYKFSETYYVPIASITAQYKKDVRQLARRVNNAAFRGFLAGEVLFMGATGSQRDSSFAEITFYFAVDEQEEITTEGGTGPFTRKGWHHTWPLIEEVEDNTANRLATEEIGVYMNRLYKDGDFSKLLIGTA